MKILFACLFSMLSLFGATPPTEPYEGHPVRKINILVENQSPDEVDEETQVIYRMHTKMGDPFDQELFDRDLKSLSDEYESVDPAIKVENGQVLITITLKKRPIITNFVIEGSSFKDKKILSEAELKKGMSYNREEFYKSIQKIRDFLVKKGFFKAEISYVVENTPINNEITIHLVIHEGPSGRINQIQFEGFTKTEESEILELIRVRKFNIFTSWLTGSGTIKDEELDPDVQTIVHHMQNHGYVDAHVTMRLEDLPENKLALVFVLNRGPKYTIHNITFSGATLKTDEDLKKASDLQPGETFSIDKIRAAQERVRELYTQEGYLHSSVDYRLDLLSNEPQYDIHFNVEESQKYRVGLVMVTGNYNTNKNVVYNNIDIEPGEVFDSRKIKSTQDRLQSTGYFKNVNVYPIKSDEHQYGASEYCDVMVEVNEAQTGSASLFGGLSSTDSAFGGIDLTENNFSIAGFRNVWFKGPSAFRGGGQFLQIKGTIGVKESDVNVSWLDPYFNDSLWRLGIDFQASTSKVLSNDYNLKTIGSTVTTSYPLTSYLNYGFRFRVKNEITDVASKEKIKNPEEYAQEQNNGIVSALASTMGFDTTDSIFRPHRGFRTNFEAEFGGLVPNKMGSNNIPFIRFGSLNAYYIPIWRKGTFKIRGDLKFTQPLSGGNGNDLPLAEHFFLGGEGTVRGYKQGMVGPIFRNVSVKENGDQEINTSPKGGMSSALLSFEYAQNIIRPLDLFTFIDAGAVSMDYWSFNKPVATYGIGARIDIGKRLPFVFGIGLPLGLSSKAYKEFKADHRDQFFFFSMGGQF
jgi:outer membrane protein insertion porin family